MRIINKNRFVVLLIVGVALCSWGISFGGESEKSANSGTSFFNEQTIVLGIQFKSSKRSGFLTKELRISYIKNMVDVLTLLESVVSDKNIKNLRESLAAPNSFTDLEVQRRGFEMAKCIRILLNEISTPFGDPIDIETLESAKKTKIIENRLNELKEYGLWNK